MITVAIQSTCRMSGVILCKRRLGQRSWWRATNHSTPRLGSIQMAKPVACNSSLPRDGEKSKFRTRKKFGSSGMLEFRVRSGRLTLAQLPQVAWRSSSRPGSFGGILETLHETHTQTWSPTCHTYQVWSNRAIRKCACASIFSSATPVSGEVRRSTEPVDQPMIGTLEIWKASKEGDWCYRKAKHTKSGWCLSLGRRFVCSRHSDKLCRPRPLLDRLHGNLDQVRFSNDRLCVVGHAPLNRRFKRFRQGAISRDVCIRCSGGLTEDHSFC